MNVVRCCSLRFSCKSVKNVVTSLAVSTPSPLAFSRRKSPSDFLNSLIPVPSENESIHSEQWQWLRAYRAELPVSSRDLDFATNWPRACPRRGSHSSPSPAFRTLEWHHHRWRRRWDGRRRTISIQWSDSVQGWTIVRALTEQARQRHKRFRHWSRRKIVLGSWGWSFSGSRTHGGALLAARDKSKSYVGVRGMLDIPAVFSTAGGMALRDSRRRRAINTLKIEWAMASVHHRNGRERDVWWHSRDRSYPFDQFRSPPWATECLSATRKENVLLLSPSTKKILLDCETNLHK